MKLSKNLLLLSFQFKGYTCICKPGTSGRNCDEIVGQCNANSCLNGGECVDLADNQYKCVCPDEFTGQFCEAIVDYCLPDPCKNGGHCKNLKKGFVCACPDEYVGDTCEVWVLSIALSNKD